MTRLPTQVSVVRVAHPLRRKPALSAEAVTEKIETPCEYVVREFAPTICRAPDVSTPERKSGLPLSPGQSTASPASIEAKVNIALGLGRKLVGCRTTSENP